MDKIADVVQNVPNEILNVSYDNNSVKVGSELTPFQVKDEPNLSWNGDPKSFYTLVFVDPDVPPQFNFKQFIHWLVVNIPGTDVSSGSHVFQYFGSGPPEGSGLHRYIFLLYKHQNRIPDSATSSIKDEKLMDRGVFSFDEFVKTHKLGDPVAANFYLAEYDDYVPKLHEKLKEKYGDF